MEISEVFKENIKKKISKGELESALAELTDTVSIIINEVAKKEGEVRTLQESVNLLLTEEDK